MESSSQGSESMRQTSASKLAPTFLTAFIGDFGVCTVYQDSSHAEGLQIEDGLGDNPREGEPNSEPIAPIEEVENPLEVLARVLLEALRIDQELNDVFEPRRMIESFRNVLNAHGPFGFGPYEEEEAEEEEEDEVDQMDAENSAKN
ncbi:unnamed protein product [Caenorhabditis brenneri]